MDTAPVKKARLGVVDQRDSVEVYKDKATRAMAQYFRHMAVLSTPHDATPITSTCM
jgi:hypothetical protein